MSYAKLVGIGFVTFVTIVTAAASANARPLRLSPDALHQTVDAVREIGFDVRSEVVQPLSLGNDEAVLFANLSFEQSVARMLAAFADNEVFADGFQVMAHATNKRTGDVNFTLKRPDGSFVLVQVQRDGEFAKLRIDGAITPAKR